MADYKVLKDVVGSSLLYGNTVYFTESGEQVPYILVHPGNSNNFLFMRKFAPKDIKVAFNEDSLSQGSSERIYENNSLDRYLSGTFFNRFTAQWQRIFVNNYIPVMSASSSYSIQRKVYAPSATEIGILNDSSGAVPTEGPTAFKYFQTNAESRRKCKVRDDDGDYVRWWTRSVNAHIFDLNNYHGITIDRTGDYDTYYWQITKESIRPIISINENVTVIKESTGWRVIPNLPPEKPKTSLKIFTVKNGESFNIDWTESQDADGPSEPNYRLQAQIDSGEWITVKETSETSFEKTLSYKEVSESIKYRVQAFDSYANYSEWTELAKISVVNNLPPTGPSFITINGKYKGESIAVSWGKASDEDDNLRGYKVYRSINNGAYALVSTTSSTVFRETAGDWNTVKYKIHAYDEAGELSTEYKEASVILTDRITMSLVVSDSSEIKDGDVFEKSSSDDEETGKILKLSLTDSEQGNVYSVVVTCDESFILDSLSNATVGDLNFEISKEEWQKISNGVHTISVRVENTRGNVIVCNLSFEKKNTGTYITLLEPVLIDSAETVSKFLINVAGSFPEGSTLSVEVTNNANDDIPVWQTVSPSEINTNKFVSFTNSHVANGNAFNFRVKAERGTATTGGYISSVNGMFGRNIFEYILARLDALEGG